MSKPGKEEYFMLWAGHVAYDGVTCAKATGLAGVLLVLPGFILTSFRRAMTGCPSKPIFNLSEVQKDGAR